MGLILTGAPATEPVSLDEAKAHLRIDHDHEDVLIASLVLTSRLHVEAALSLALITQAWTYQLDEWPMQDVVDLPLAPLQAVTAVRITSAEGLSQLSAPTNYLVDLVSKPPRLIWNSVTRPAPGVAVAGIEIDLTAGFGTNADAVPAPLKHAILMLTAHWYENREAAQCDAPAARIPAAISDLIQPFRSIRL